eukprot:9489492-Pyramimonas_sp.AAC.1
MEPPFATSRCIARLHAIEGATLRGHPLLPGLSPTQPMLQRGLARISLQFLEGHGSARYLDP